MHKLENAAASACAEVEDKLTRVRVHVRYCRNVAACKVNNVDIVAHSGAVGGVVVVTENAQIFKSADGGL